MDSNLLYNKYLKPVFKFFEDEGYSYSARSHLLGNNQCCCGDKLVHTCNTHDPLGLKTKYGLNYTVDDGLYELGELRQCNMRSLYTSNRRGDNVTCEDFYKAYFDRTSTKFNPEFNFKKWNGSMVQKSLDDYF